MLVNVKLISGFLKGLSSKKAGQPFLWAQHGKKHKGDLHEILIPARRCWSPKPSRRVSYQSKHEKGILSGQALYWVAFVVLDRSLVKFMNINIGIVFSWPLGIIK